MPTLARHKKDGTIADVHEALALHALSQALGNKVQYVCMVCGEDVEARKIDEWPARFEHLKKSSACLD